MILVTKNGNFNNKWYKRKAAILPFARSNIFPRGFMISHMEFENVT